MRRTQPQCITLILTGYPALDTALQAIRSQVDDYIIKPASIPSLLATIEQKLQQPGSRHPLVAKRLAQLLRDATDEILQRMQHAMNAQPELDPIPLGDQELRHIPRVLDQLCEALEAGACEGISLHGLVGAQGGERGSLSLLAVNVRLLQTAIYEVIHENLLSLDLSHLMPDLIVLNSSLARQLQQSLREFAEAEHRTA
jgi:CheY-like chemotaxis protein